MATIEETTHLYEVLLRFGQAGLAGAHQRNLTAVTNTVTGQVYSAVEGPPEPVSPEALAGLVDPQVPVMAAQIVELLALVEVQARQIGDHAATIAAQAAQIAQATAQLAGQEVMMVRARELIERLTAAQQSPTPAGA